MTATLLPPVIDDLPRTLVVTGHFPPEHGGVQTFTWEIVRRLPPQRLVVVAPAWPGDREFDAQLPFPVIRRHGYLLFAGLRRLIRQHGVTAGWIPAMAPFGLYAPLVRAAGIRHLVGSTHGQELGWVRAWPTRLAMRRMVRSVDVLTYLSEITRDELAAAGALPGQATRLVGGVDTVRFRRDPDVERPTGGPVVVSVARLVRRKGHDRLLDAWHRVRRERPDAQLVVVGDGPMREKLARRAAAEHPGSVTITGPVPDLELPRRYAQADVFVLPCRDDRHGLQSEGLGLSTLEASASELPVVVGDSGGSSASVLHGETGLLVDATRPDEIADALLRLLGDPERGRAMGRAGRAWVQRRFTWDGAARRLASALQGDRAPTPAADGDA